MHEITSKFIVNNIKTNSLRCFKFSSRFSISVLHFNYSVYVSNPSLSFQVTFGCTGPGMYFQGKICPLAVSFPILLSLNGMLTNFAKDSPTEQTTRAA